MTNQQQLAYEAHKRRLSDAVREVRDTMTNDDTVWTSEEFASLLAGSSGKHEVCEREILEELTGLEFNGEAR